MSEAATIKDVAAKLNVSRCSVYRLVKAGRIPAFRVGKHLRFDLAAVVAAVKDERTLRL